MRFPEDLCLSTTMFCQTSMLHMRPVLLCTIAETNPPFYHHNLPFELIRITVNFGCFWRAMDVLTPHGPKTLLSFLLFISKLVPFNPLVVGLIPILLTANWSPSITDSFFNYLLVLVYPYQ